MSFQAFTLQQLRDLPPEHSIVRKPVRVALKLGITKIGRILHKEGGHALMEEICDRVDGLPGNENSSFPAVLIDKCWDGVGTWLA
jgi:hypothetical protein